MPHALASFFVMIDIDDIDGDHSKCSVDHRHSTRGEVGNQHRLRLLMSRVQQKKMIDEEPRDCFREVAAERIEIGETLCNYVSRQTQKGGKKLRGSVLLGALRGASLLCFYQQLPHHQLIMQLACHLSQSPKIGTKDQQIPGINVTSPSRFLEMSVSV